MSRGMKLIFRCSLYVFLIDLFWLILVFPILGLGQPLASYMPLYPDDAPHEPELISLPIEPVNLINTEPESGLPGSRKASGSIQIPAAIRYE